MQQTATRCAAHAFCEAARLFLAERRMVGAGANCLCYDGVDPPGQRWAASFWTCPSCSRIPGGFAFARGCSFWCCRTCSSANLTRACTALAALVCGAASGDVPGTVTYFKLETAGRAASAPGTCHPGGRRPPAWRARRGWTYRPTMLWTLAVFLVLSWQLSRLCLRGAP